MDGYAAPIGPSIIRLIEDELDRGVDHAAHFVDTGDTVARDKARSYALGLATALAYLYNPYHPDVDAQREAAKARRAVAKNRGVR